MRISVDGQLVKEVKLGAEGGAEQNWDASMKTLYRNSVPVEAQVKKGRHNIVLENHGTTWISGEVDLSNYLKSEVPNARVFGLGSGERAYLWIQNRDRTWWRDCLNQAPRPIKKAVIEIGGFTPGSYEVEWRDPWGVKPAKRQLAKTENGCLRFAVTRLERDIACKIKRTRSRQYD